MSLGVQHRPARVWMDEESGQISPEQLPHVSTSFLFVAESYSIVQTDCVLFTHSSVGRHFGCFTLFSN